MSIFPVKITEWYEEGPFAEEADMLKNMIPYLKCTNCGGPITWKKGWVMHSITFGGPDGAWCSKKCLDRR